jgi:hypothetical protein
MLSTGRPRLENSANWQSAEGAILAARGWLAKIRRGWESCFTRARARVLSNLQYSSCWYRTGPGRASLSVQNCRNAKCKKWRHIVQFLSGFSATAAVMVFWHLESCKKSRNSWISTQNDTNWRNFMQGVSCFINSCSKVDFSGERLMVCWKIWGFWNSFSYKIVLKTWKIPWGSPCSCPTIWVASWNFTRL